MRSVEGKPSKNSACQLDLLTVLVCPVTVLGGQVTESAGGWSERLTESACGWAERVAESAGGWAEAITPQAALTLVVLAVGYKVYQLYSPRRGNAAGTQSFEPLMIPLRDIDPPRPPAPPPVLRPRFRSRPTVPDMTPSYDDTMPSSSAPSLDTPPPYEAPPPYEDPPPYDSSWATPNCPANGSD
eukprot:Blabericola_migrator_1__9044@NODE_4812_length_971_cov_33_217920_g3001_i0_p1_GENE_NODE_4812_length_971_cov_33_217920_g3001_i0NODE_4812_length_971_cov_33_217920_g3001_i0_p1_ORF_typecomplete_len185_score22_18_NODE_4812_length_971_cov_33_217920_g3001_i0289843